MSRLGQSGVRFFQMVWVKIAEPHAPILMQIPAITAWIATCPNSRGVGGKVRNVRSKKLRNTTVVVNPKSTLDVRILFIFPYYGIGFSALSLRGRLGLRPRNTMPSTAVATKSTDIIQNGKFAKSASNVIIGRRTPMIPQPHLVMICAHRNPINPQIEMAIIPNPSQNIPGYAHACSINPSAPKEPRRHASGRNTPRVRKKLRQEHPVADSHLPCSMPSF